MTTSRMSSKLTYATRIYFLDRGDDNRSSYMVDPFLAYWLSYNVPSSPEDKLKTYVFPLTILIVRSYSYWISSTSGLYTHGWTSRQYSSICRRCNIVTNTTPAHPTVSWLQNWWSTPRMWWRRLSWLKETLETHTSLSLEVAQRQTCL